MWRAFIASVLVALPLSAADSLQDYLRSKGKRPVEYVLAKLDDHRVVILGEGHWMRSDSELVAALVPELRRRGVALAVELFPAERQQDWSTPRIPRDAFSRTAACITASHAICRSSGAAEGGPRSS